MIQMNLKITHTVKYYKGAVSQIWGPVLRMVCAIVYMGDAAYAAYLGRPMNSEQWVTHHCPGRPMKS
jgi:hypothetical protein